MEATYKVNEETNAVEIFIDGNDVPLIFQPNWPDNTEWASAEESAAWAELWIDQFLNSSTAEFLPGVSPSEPKIANPALVPAEETPAE